MKKKYTFTCAVLIAAALTCPIAADWNNAPIADEIHNRIAYGTPTIDGYLDSAYMQSERIDYKLQPSYLFPDKDISPEENVKKYFSWDTGIEAYTYMLWDDENLYVYTAVKDSSSGIVDFDKVTLNPLWPHIYTYQDGIYFRFYFNDIMYPVFAERGGRFFGLTDCRYDEEVSGLTNLDGFPDNNEKIIGLNRDCFVTISSDNSYVTEFKIPLTSRGAEYVYMGAQMQQSTVIFNYIDTVPYGMWRGYVGTEPGFTYGILYGEFVYGKKYDENTISKINRYMNFVGSSKGDVNGDSYTDSRDLVRLMKNIAENIVTEPTSDVNLDGEVDARDLVALMRIIARG